jgi:hypothetical protein
MAEVMNKSDFVNDNAFGSGVRSFSLSLEAVNLATVSALGGVNVGSQQLGERNKDNRYKKLHLTSAKTVVERITGKKVPG